MNTIALSFACVAAAILPQPHGTTAAASGVRKFLADWAEGWRKGRVDHMLAFYGDSETVAAVESRGILRKGLPGIRKMYEEAFGELVFEKVELKTEVMSEAADAAWATCRYKADVRTRADNRRYVLEVRGSFVLQRSGDEWRIALEHFSTIEGVPRARHAEIGGGR